MFNVFLFIKVISKQKCILKNNNFSIKKIKDILIYINVGKISYKIFKIQTQISFS
jgi:hypothetical protein